MAKLDYAIPVVASTRGWSFWVVYLVASLFGAIISGNLHTYGRLLIDGFHGDGGSSVIFSLLMSVVFGLSILLTKINNPVTGFVIAALPMPTIINSGLAIALLR